MNPGRQIIRLAVALLVTCATLFPSLLHAMPRSGQQAPNFKVVSTSGQPITIDNYKGYVLVIDFFATWCPPCKESIPHLVEMNRKYSKQGLQVLGLSLDEDGERAVKSFAGEYRINYPLALADETVQVDFGLRSVPVMFVIDKKGKIAEIYRGFSEEIGRSLENVVKRLLAEK
jgi:peroxiredoxin